MLNYRMEHEQAQAIIIQLRLQQRQQQQHYLDSQDYLSHLGVACEATQRLADLNKEIADVSSNNFELVADLRRALGVAQRVMEQKQSLQERCKLQQDQLNQEQFMNS